ncbi:hypothetical protein ElyMa_004832200 [Elysia marginata]|uniref:Uncharacterized protein n=1 Tax=Elysia marginata TaxID=1093978 RepID=A0AAV4IN21_9GAST|nr:hypothetical protein ElyMa_004832200 [Elysia marginata]
MSLPTKRQPTRTPRPSSSTSHYNRILILGVLLSADPQPSLLVADVTLSPGCPESCLGAEDVDLTGHQLFYIPGPVRMGKNFISLIIELLTASVSIRAIFSSA